VKITTTMGKRIFSQVLDGSADPMELCDNAHMQANHRLLMLAAGQAWR